MATQAHTEQSQDVEHGSAAATLLRRCWTQWTAIVELFALRRRARNRVNPQEYRELYETIMEACRVQTQQADETRRAFFQELEQLVRPWVSPQSLAWANQEVALKLLARCQEAHRQLTGRSPLSPAWRRAVLVFVVGFVLALGAALVASHLRGGGGALSLLPMRRKASSTWRGTTSGEPP